MTGETDDPVNDPRIQDQVHSNQIDHQNADQGQWNKCQESQVGPAGHRLAMSQAYGLSQVVGSQRDRLELVFRAAWHADLELGRVGVRREADGHPSETRCGSLRGKGVPWPTMSSCWRCLLLNSG